MGPLVDLLGGGANSFHANAPVNTWKPDAANPLQTSQYGSAINTAQGAAAGGANANAGVQGQQSALANMLNAQAQGGGPNPALAQLHQTTAQNINNAASQVAGTRGINPALAARMALDAGASANQQAAGQAATMRAQQTLGAQSQLGNVLGQQAGQNIAQQQANTQLLGTAGGLQNQQNQGNLGLQGLQQQTAGQNAGLELGAQQLNAGVASQNTQVGQGILGGLMNGAGAAIGLAGGGSVPQIMHYDDGGVAGLAPMDTSDPLHMYMQGLNTSYLKPPTANISPGQLQPPREFGSGSNPMPGSAQGVGSMQLSSPMLGINSQPGFDPASIMRQGGADADAADKTKKNIGKGIGDVGAGVSADSMGAYNRFANMHLAGSMYANGGSIFAADGGVPGHAAVKGDSEQNDKVPAMLSPGEIVIPRSIAQAPDAAARAHDFVSHLVQRSGGGYGRVLKARGMAEGGEVDKPKKETEGGAGGAGAQDQQSVADKIKGMLPSWLQGQKTAPVNVNERKQLDQVRDYSEGGIVESVRKTGTARGLGGATHRSRIKKADKPSYSTVD